MNINEELERRNKMKDDDSNIIGTEIKNRRHDLSLTLSEVAENTCSPSYLCKLEKSQILGNDKRVEEICRRVGMNKEQLHNLINLRKTLNLAVDYYFENNKNGLLKIKSQIAVFNNYRSDLINYIINVFENDTYQSSKLCKKLTKIIKELNDNELVIFATFYSISLLNDNKPIEASKNAKKAISIICDIPKLKIIQYECLFMCAYNTLSVNVYKYYEKLKKLYIENNLYDKLQNLSYKMAILEMHQKRLSEFNFYASKVVKENLKYNLGFAKSYMLSQFDNLKKYKVNKLDNLFKMIYLFYFDEIKFINEINNLDSTISSRDFLLINGMYSQIMNKKTQYIIEEGLPMAIKIADLYVMNHYLSILSGLIQNQGSYLNFYNFFVEVDSKRNEIINV